MERIVVSHKLGSLLDIPVSVEFLGNTFILEYAICNSIKEIYECTYVHVDKFMKGDE